MQRNTRGLLPCIVFGVLTGAVLPAAALTLTLEEASRIAEQANPALRNAQAAIHAVEGQLAESRAPFWDAARGRLLVDAMSDYLPLTYPCRPTPSDAAHRAA